MSDAPAPGTPAHDRRSVMLPVAAVVVGTALVVVGTWQALTWDFSVGWFAYAPMSDTTFAPRIPNYWLPPALIGIGALFLGLGTGFVLGRRRS